MNKQLKGFDVSVIIPINNVSKYMPLLLKSIENQTVLPKEIVIVDSCLDSDAALIIKNMNIRNPLIHKKIDLVCPGGARNIGVEIAKSEWIAFLDSTTVPEHDWLERCVEMAIEKKVGFVGGFTLFEADTYFKKLLRATSYGCSPCGTLPGSIIKKEVFEKSGGFIPGIRSSEDIEWIERIKALGIKMDTIKYPVTKYYGLPDDLWLAIKKYYKFAIATAQTDVLRGQKKLYMSILLILLTILVYNWNLYFTGFDENNILFIPHITKLYLVFLAMLYVVFKGFMRPWNRKVKLGFFEKAYLLVIVILTTGLVYKWNLIFAHFNVKSVFYIPHITKIYVASLLLLSLVFRGIIRPLRRNVEWSFVFPFKWVLIGLLGATLDIVKTPGYIWGGILGIMGKTIHRTE